MTKSEDKTKHRPAGKIGDSDPRPCLIERGLIDESLGEFGKQVISGASVGIGIYDRNLRYVAWNPFIEEMMGLRAEEVLGKHDSELFPFVKEEGLDGLLEKALTGETASCPDFPFYVPKSGRAGWGSSRYEPLRDSSGEIVGVLATVQDITQLKFAQQAQRQSEERYRTVVERAADVIYMVSPDCTIISLNQAFETLTGWERVDWIGKSFLTILHPDDLSVAAALFQRVYSRESAPAFELRFLSKAGEYLVGECTAAPQIENGRVVAASGMVRDVTARKQAEDALRQSENRFRTLAETAADAIITVDESGSITFTNQAAERVFGYSQQEMLNGQLTLLMPEYLHHLHGSGFASYKETGKRHISWEVMELPGQHKDGTEIPLELSFGGFTQDNKRFFTGIARDVTARKRAEEALRQAEADYQSIFEHALDGMFRSTPGGRFLLVNPALAEMLGYDSPEDLIESVGAMGRQFYSDPQHRDQYERLMKEHGVVERFENQVLRKDECVISVEESGRAVRSSSGELLFYEGTIRDITERKGAVEALRHSEEKYRELVENINDIVYAADDRGSITYMSPVVELITGHKQSEITGRSVAEFVYPDDLPPFLESFNQTIAGAIEPLEYRIVTKSGEVRWVRNSSRPVFDGERAVGLRGIIADITTYKRVEAHLQRLATAVEQAAESIVITDTDGAIQYVNPAFERATGYLSDEVCGQHPRFLKRGVTDVEFYQGVWTTITSGKVWTGRFITKRKDGTLFEEEATISPVRDGSGSIVNFVAVKRDVTKEVELEKQLLHAQKMEAVGRLAGGVAHDFNNLLTAIIGYGQIVDGRLGANHPLRSEVKEILDAGHRAAALTSQLLAFSRRQTLIPRNINLNETIGNLMRMLQRIIGEDVDLSFQASSSLYPVLADAGQIEQVIMNLAVNARDAMPAGGTLIIETHNVTLDEAFCREHLWARPGEYARISVSDSGDGMDSETRRRIFEPFFTTKEIGKGTGLGLAVVYGIVKQHDGLIHVYSEPGHGTIFKLYLKAQSSVPRDEAPQGPIAVRGGSETILVAEDEETLRQLAETVLGNLGYRVLLASNGEEAVVAFENAECKIDLVILDLIMPRMSGRAAYARIHAMDKHVPVIFMTGYASGTLQTELLEEDGAVLIQKPYDVDELGRKVREALDR